MSTDPRVRHVIALLEQRPEAPPTAAELSRAVNLSTAHLARLFRRETGMSPGSFGRRLRLERARRLLQTSFMTVKEVMAASGWNDPSHFSREFKRQHGQSPLAFRRTAGPENTEDLDGGPSGDARR
jgi:transcriptional regulator GlxA family with amidase domain